PISLRQSSKSPTQSLKVPIFATFPGMSKPLEPPRTQSNTKDFPVRTSCYLVSLVVYVDIPLLCLKYRWPLLHVSSQPFLSVLALEEQLLILALHRQCRLHRNLPTCLHRTFDASHSLRGFVRRTEL